MSRTRLYVGNVSRRSRTSDVEYLFSKYGRVIDIDLKHDYGFVEFDDPRDAEDAIYELDGYRLDGVRLVVERARHPRGGSRFDDRGRSRDDRPVPGAGKCYNCGKEGHWARDCSSGDWSNRCYKCGKDGHLERACPNDGAVSKDYDRKSSRSVSPRRGRSISASPRRGRSSRSRSRSPRSRSPVRRSKDDDIAEDDADNVVMSAAPTDVVEEVVQEIVEEVVEPVAVEPVAVEPVAVEPMAVEPVIEVSSPKVEEIVPQETQEDLPDGE